MPATFRTAQNERYGIMLTYNNYHTAPPKRISDIRELYRTSAEEFGDKIQYYYRENGQICEFTYNDFWENMQNFATYLMSSHLAGKRVAVVGDTHPLWLVTFASVICSGGVIVPLDRELEIDQLIDFMRIADCSAVVYTDFFNNKFTARAADMSFIDTFIPIASDGETCTLPFVKPFRDCVSEGAAKRASGSDCFEKHEIVLDDMAAILFTSGTTGTSKGVMLSHRNFVATTNAASFHTKFDRRDTFVSVLPIHHTFELATSHLASSNLGTTTYINESLRYATRNFKEFRPTSLILVPLFLETIHKRIWETIRKKGIEKKVRTAMKISDGLLMTGVDMRQKFFSDITDVFGGKLKTIIVGGAPIDPQIIRDFYSFGISVFQGYGITECSPLISVNMPGHVKFDSVGQVVESCVAKIDPIDECDDGEGEILVRGDNVMLGYYENPEATAEVFTDDGYFRTGDIGKIDRKGYITITGRKKNVIIASNGKNVFPEELEERLAKFPLIKESVVLGRDDQNTGDVVITALIYPDPELVDGKLSNDEVCAQLKEQITKINKALPPYKHINKFEIRNEEFEKTPSKKIKRFLLK